MTTAKHTPGPWALGRNNSPQSIFGPDDPFFAIAKVYLTDPKSRRRTLEFQGNATLIQAAPDLLEACQKVMGAFAYAPGSVQEPHWLAAVRVAVAKAEGGKA